MTTAAESARLAALRQYAILDTEPEQRFDDLTLLASQICGAPIALITLVDAERQWFKSRVGLSQRETSRTISFCSHAIEQRGLFVIKDATQDARFRNNPQVTGGHRIRFYAGAPLVTPEGHALGTICVIDHVPRDLTADQRLAMEALRRQVEAQLELRRNLLDLERALAERDRAETEQRRLYNDLHTAHENVRKLSAMMPLCSTCQFTMTIQADPRAIPTITDGVTQVLTEKGWNERDIMAVELALQEAVANAIRHGCRGDASKQLECTVNCDDAGEVVITVRDSGEGFDPMVIPDPLDPANVLKPSGRGIFLINGLMDDVRYVDGGRELQMRKRKPAPL
jgi:anti-sigma regulatory factor (Ser/Thr protein kinase)